MIGALRQLWTKALARSLPTFANFSPLLRTFAGLWPAFDPSQFRLQGLGSRTNAEPEPVPPPAPFVPPEDPLAAMVDCWTAIAPPAEPASLEVEAPAPRRKPLRVRDSAEGHIYYFREGLLDQLDEHMRHVRRLQRIDPDAYKAYTKLGAILMPWSKTNWINHSQLPTTWRLLPDKRPAFGAFSFLSPAKKDPELAEKFCYPRLVYFTKYKGRPSFSELAKDGCDYFLLNFFWDETEHKQDKRWKWVLNFPIAVDPSGEVLVLRGRIITEQVIKHRTHGEWRGHTSRIPQVKWDLPEELRVWAKENDFEPMEFVKFLFVSAANIYEALNLSTIRVNVTRRGVTAVFGIDMLRTPYFFKDREVTIGPTGGKRRIFHIVRPHPRTRGNRSSNVHAHFRGERRFLWNGYDVNITVPGLHHTPITDFNIGAVDEEDFPDLKQGIPFGDIAALLAEEVAGKPLRQAFDEYQQRKPHLDA